MSVGPSSEPEVRAGIGVGSITMNISKMSSPVLPKMTNHQTHEVTPAAWIKSRLHLQRQVS
jgi:hypothetical protein